MSDVEQAKRHAAERAIEEVRDGMVLGLGSGSTAALAIRRLGDRIETGLDVVGVPTSHQAARVARNANVPVRCLADVEGVDLAIDGADQVAEFDLLKGGGGAHTREKIVATAADRFIVVVDDSKLVDALNMAVPVEIIVDGLPLVRDHIHSLGGRPELRTSVDTAGPTVTDNGNFILDCAFGELSEPAALAQQLDRIPGVLAHGLFPDHPDAIYTGTAADVRVRERS